MRGRLFPTDSDWCEWRQEPPLPSAVLVRVAEGGDGRLVLTGLRIDGPPSAEMLRSIPVGRIEAAANAQLSFVGDTVVSAASPRPPRRGSAVAEAADLGWEAPDPSQALPRPNGPRPNGRPAAAAAPASAEAPTAALASAAATLSTGETIGGQRGRSDDFYRQVGRAYLDLAQTTSRPAAELAEANEVPVSTVHRWVKEARRRGVLPPGRPGKAG